MRRHPLAFIVLALPLLTSSVILISEYQCVGVVAQANPRDIRLEARAVRDVNDIVEFIGHGVAIREIEARWFDERWAAAYWWDRKITIEAELWFADDMLLFVMAHECVHALFRQRNLLVESPPILEYQNLVHETAASVLGAHIAGAIWTRRGGNGAVLTKRLLADYRVACDNFYSEELILRYSDLRDSANWGIEEPKRVYWPGGYFGTKGLIDAIDPICREHSDPYEAAHAIATSLHNVDEETARKIPIPRDWRPNRRK